jgi:hypothetical protein
MQRIRKHIFLVTVSDREGGENLFLVALSGQGTERISFTAESLIIWLLDGFFHVTGNSFLLTM